MEVPRFFLSVLDLACLQLEIICTPEWHILGQPSLNPIKREEEGEEKSDNLGVLVKTQFSFVSMPDAWRVFPTASNSATPACCPTI